MRNDSETMGYDFKEDEIDLKELMKVLIKDKSLVVYITAFFSIIGVLYSLSLPNVYQSTTLLYPTEQQNNNIAGAMKAYSGLAGIAGINVSSQASESNSVKALKKLTSLSFFTENLMPNIFLPNLFAIDSWNEDSNTIIYDNDIYDNTKKSWTRDFSYPQTQIPSSQEGYEVFMKHLLVSEDPDSGFVTIAVKHQSPYIAQKWTELVVNQINNYFRTKDKIEAEIAVAYLQEQIAKTNFTEVKQVIAELLQGRTQQLSLIEVGEYYVFAYIDPPVVMEKKVEPIRSKICLFFAFSGLIFSLIFIIFRHYYKKREG